MLDTNSFVMPEYKLTRRKGNHNFQSMEWKNRKIFHLHLQENIVRERVLI